MGPVGHQVLGGGRTRSLQHGKITAFGMNSTM